MSEKKELSNEELLARQQQQFEAYKKESSLQKVKSAGYGVAVAVCFF
ncbi:hypothetical protein JGZ12_12520 [Staphylococcus pseudintermedius]|nr:hypothetical protein [Staphylococcus pseudintermedius]MBJ8233495.1 hypothetical protein [Staphylococcus pseudintermedius]